jgi:hypothetical protein
VALATLTRLHRRDLQALAAESAKDLRVFWRGFKSAESARDMLMEGLPQLVALYGAAAATMGADYYDEARDVEGVRGSYRAAPAAPAGGESLDVLARVAVGPLFQAVPDFASALTLAEGGLQRHIANADRETVTLASVDDKRARGWERVGVGGCDFCSMLLGRGAVYTEATADFAAHDHCNCTAQPVFG